MPMNIIEQVWGSGLPVLKNAFAQVLKVPETSIVEVWKAVGRPLYVLNIQDKDGSTLQSIWSDINPRKHTGQEQFVVGGKLIAQGPFQLEETGIVLDLFESNSWMIQITDQIAGQKPTVIFHPRIKMFSLYPPLLKQNEEFVQSINESGLGEGSLLESAWKIHGVVHGVENFSNNELYLLVLQKGEDFEIWIASVTVGHTVVLHKKFEGKQANRKVFVYNNGTFKQGLSLGKILDKEGEGMAFETVI